MMLNKVHQTENNIFMYFYLNIASVFESRIMFQELKKSELLIILIIYLIDNLLT